MMDDEETEGEAPSAADNGPAYYYADGGRPALGPCSLAQLRVLWVTGHITGATSVWREGLGSWSPISALEEVSELLALQQPPRQDAGEWHYLDAGQQRCGGITAAQMGVLFQRGEVDGLTHVWREGMSAWAELGSVDALRAQLQRSGDDDDDDDNGAVERAAAIARAQEMAYDPDEAFVRRQPPASAAAAAAGGATVVATGASSDRGADAVSGGTRSDDLGAGSAGSADAPAKPKRVRKSGQRFVSKAGANVYVSGLPPDVSVDELVECFKVAGVLKADPATGAKRIKLYTDAATGDGKGDALMSFLKSESVGLAVTLRDGYDLRDGWRLSVQPAKFEKREGVEGSGRLGKEAKMQRKKQRVLEQKALAEWEAGMAPGKRNCTVVLMGLFEASDVPPDEAAAFYANLRQDVEVECRKAGTLEKAHVFEGSERGAVSVRFREADDAERCAAMLDERAFGGRTIRCEVYDGVTDYRALNKREAHAPATMPSVALSADSAAATSGGGSAGESAVDQEKNLDAFADWLEADSTDEEAGEDGD